MAKRRAESGEEKGNWLDTYADMVTLLLCFFVLLYSASATESRRFAIRRQTATFSKAEFAAAHSRKGGICCGSQPQRRNLLRLIAATSHCHPADNESYAAVKPLERRNCLRRHAAVSA